MLKMISPYFTHSDKRGSLVGLVNFGEWREINLIKSEKDTIRGQHYHRLSTELFIIQEGRILVKYQKIVDQKLFGPEECVEVKRGDVFVILPMTMHTFIVKEDSTWLNALDKSMDPTSPDLHRL